VDQRSLGQLELCGYKQYKKVDRLLESGTNNPISVVKYAVDK